MSGRSGWGPRRRMEQALETVERRIKQQPGSAEVRFERASLLEALGRMEQAKEAYFDLLSKDPRHFGGLNNLGNVLVRLGQRRAALACFEEAVKHHPGNPLGRVSLGIALVDLDDLPSARTHFEAALQADPNHAVAHQGMSYVLTRLGDEEGAERHRRLGFRARPVEVLPYRGEGPPVEVLLLLSATGGNIDTDRLLDDRLFATTKVYVEFFDLAGSLPRHKVIFNAVGDADRAGQALDAVRAVVEKSGMPAINDPGAVAVTGRMGNAERLSGLEGVIAPKIAPIPREQFAPERAAAALAERGFGYPVLLRSPGHHTGRHFELIEGPDRLAEAAAALPGEELLAIEYLDARGADGAARKYRVMFVGGEMYPLHLAVSDLWKVHYYTADMADNPEHRIEEAEFLGDMPGVVGERGMAALGRIRDALGLDYGGIDFALSPAGEILVFEANATMTVPRPPGDPKWAYRREPIQRILDAVRLLIVRKAGEAGARKTNPA